jgi:cellulose 1,4-beta-cellobiosidase
MKKSASLIIVAAAAAVIVFGGCQQITTDDTTPPAKPSGLSLTAGFSQVDVSWTDTGADSYTVYWAAGSSASKSSPGKHAGITASSYTVSGLTNATQYAFVVTATVAGVESAESLVSTATPNYLAAPNLTTSAMKLTWYWPGGADLTNSSGSTRYFTMDDSTDNTFATGVSTSTVSIAAGATQEGGFGTSGHYYRVAHLASSSGPRDSNYSNTLTY